MLTPCRDSLRSMFLHRPTAFPFSMRPGKTTRLGSPTTIGSRSRLRHSQILSRRPIRDSLFERPLSALKGALQRSGWNSGAARDRMGSNCSTRVCFPLAEQGLNSGTQTTRSSQPAFRPATGRSRRGSTLGKPPPSVALRSSYRALHREPCDDVAVAPAWCRSDRLDTVVDDGSRNAPNRSRLTAPHTSTTTARLRRYWRSVSPRRAGRS